MLKEKILTIKNEEPMQNKQSYRYDNDVKIAILENSVGHINQTLERIEKRFDSIDKKFESIENKMEKGFNQLNQKIDSVDEKLSKRMEKIDDKLWQNMAWILGTLGTLIVGIVLTVCRSFHWIG